MKTITRDGARIVIDFPVPFDATKQTRLILYALPNGNTIEQTIGAQRAEGLDWRYDIQHIGAQTRLWREINPDENVVIAYFEADNRSWPTWKSQRLQKHGATIRDLVRSVRSEIPADDVRITLTGHSGGGTFIFGYINGGDTIPTEVDRIAFLDANYAYDDAELHHGDKLLAWLGADSQHRLIVMAYDDREITVDGKKVVSDTGGTYRASHRMIERFSKEVKFDTSKSGGFQQLSALDGRVTILIHPNPDVKILHTTIVGEWNGYLHAIALGTPLEGKWGTFGGGRAYAKYIQPAPAIPTTAPTTRSGELSIPTRPANAIGGRAFMTSIAPLVPAEREAAIVREITRGNIPQFLRSFKTIRVRATGIDGVERAAEYEVMPDYLAVGSDDDFIRVPMTPMSAQAVAGAFGCAIPTRKIVDDVYAQADVKLEPRPLTEEREAVATFVQHHDIIESQRGDQPLGSLVAGIKKDVVVTNRLSEEPRRVAIYGWHKPDGNPIQPLTIVHKDTYVDYSHGIRLMKRAVTVDAKPLTIDDVLRDPHLCALISDEGPIDARYQK